MPSPAKVDPVTGRVTGNFTHGERIIALGMDQHGASTREIAEKLNRSVKSISGFLGSGQRLPRVVSCVPAGVSIPIDVGHAAKLSASSATESAPVVRDEDKADFAIVSSPYTLGLTASAILFRLNRARKAAGKPEVGMERIHQLALSYGLRRPEPARPPLLPRPAVLGGPTP